MSLTLSACKCTVALTVLRLLVGAPNFGHVMPLAPEPGFGFQYKCDIEDDPAFMQEKGTYTCTPRAFESERRTFLTKAYRYVKLLLN